MRNFKGYTGVDTNSKIMRDAQYMLDKSLEDSYSSTECIVSPNGNMKNEYSTKIQVFPKNNSDGALVKVVGRICDIERGNYLKFNDEVWLVVNKPYDNEVFRKSEASVCANYFLVKYEDKRVLIGYDKLNRPIYEIISGETIKLPCVVKMNDSSTTTVDINGPINLLDNQVLITIPYTEAPSIKYDETFELYDEIYRIIRIDPSKSINKVGILRIIGQRKGSVGGNS